jgi:hypothetical protein
MPHEIVDRRGVGLQVARVAKLLGRDLVDTTGLTSHRRMFILVQVMILSL